LSVIFPREEPPRFLTEGRMSMTKLGLAFLLCLVYCCWVGLSRIFFCVIWFCLLVCKAIGWDIVISFVFTGEFNPKKIIASNEHLCLINSHILHESDNLGEITKMFADKITHF